MSDTALDAAKAEALDEEVVESPELESVEEEAVEEEVIEEEIEEDIEDILPTDHKERSDFGRKVSALLKKTDQMEEIMANQNKLFEHLIAKENNDDYSNDEYVTQAQLLQMNNQKQQADTKYEDDFKIAFAEMSEGLDEETQTKVGSILMGNYNTKLSTDGYKDGAKAYAKAYTDYTTKRTPLQGKKASGVATTQKVKVKEKKLVKLSAASKSLLKSIERDKGAEKALQFHKEIS